MDDREKVINGLKLLAHWPDGLIITDREKWIKPCCEMAVAMLKEQEAVEPILEQDSMVCGVCGHEVIWQKMLGDGIWADEELDYCPHCGRPVKWE